MWGSATTYRSPAPRVRSGLFASSASSSPDAAGGRALSVTFDTYRARTPPRTATLVRTILPGRSESSAVERIADAKFSPPDAMPVPPTCGRCGVCLPAPLVLEIVLGLLLARGLRIPLTSGTGRSGAHSRGPACGCALLGVNCEPSCTGKIHPRDRRAPRHRGRALDRATADRDSRNRARTRPAPTSAPRGRGRDHPGANLLALVPGRQAARPGIALLTGSDDVTGPTGRASGGVARRSIRVDR